MALLSVDFGALFQLIRRFLGPFGKVLDKVKETYDHLVNILNDADHLADSIRGEITAWKTFKQDIRIRQRVVQIERAIEKTRSLIQGIPEAWRSILEIIKQVRANIGGGADAATEAEAAVEEVEAGGVKGILERFPALARGLERLLGVLAILIQALESISKVIQDVQQIVDEIKAIRLEIERLDTIFLQQSNKRKTVRLADGRTLKIRVGKLHDNF
jgi:methyl-accepting chemotaxis protein